jgi:hypothetical protein
MDNKLCGEFISSGDFTISGSATAKAFTLFKETFSCRPVDRPVDSSTAQQGGVGGVYDRIHFESSNVTFKELNSVHFHPSKSLVTLTKIKWSHQLKK